MRKFVFAILAAIVPCVHAVELDTRLIEQGGVAVTVADVDAFLARMPQDRWAGFLDSPTRVEQMMTSVVRDKQLEAQAVAANMDKDPNVQAQIALARTEVLSRARLAAFEKSLKIPDMAVAAKEQYVAHKSDYAVPPDVEVQHVLISLKGRTDAEAKALAEKVRAQALADPGSFDDLVDKYSEDKGSMKGHIRGAAGQGVVAEFAAAAASLKTIGEISSPVKTNFGYHILKLTRVTPARQVTFEQAKPQIESQLRQKYVTEQRTAFLAKLDQAPPTINPKMGEILRQRYVPTDVVSPTEAARAKNP